MNIKEKKVDVINILDSQSANMIAAGEVVERPASAVKELIENALDSGAKSIGVEVKNGGVTLIRVSDDGCGISAADLPKSVLRHATSKIKCGTDIDGVTTLGFRGEALAAISSVSKLQIISRQADSDFGNLLVCDEGAVTVEEIGCPVGTTVLVESLFYNTPARRKFLKKDATEAAACRSAVEKAALSNPDVSFRFISDGEQKLSTDGSGSLQNAIYDVLGDARAKDLIEVEGKAEPVTVSGYISAPSAAVGRNTAQNTFVNGRYVQSKTVQAAVKEAFKSYLPHDRYPITVLFVTVPPKFVDVNVHPAKTEIKFADERVVYEAVYYAVRGALERKDAFTGGEDDIFVSGGDIKPQADIAPAAPSTAVPFVDSERQNDSAMLKSVVLDAAKPSYVTFDADSLAGEELPKRVSTESYGLSQPSVLSMSAPPPPVQGVMDARAVYKYVGEAFNAYIIAETRDALYIIDKHAAHERILYEEIKKSTAAQSQTLLVGEVAELSAEECALLIENRDYLGGFGFDIDAFGDNSVVVRAVPPAVKGEGCAALLSEFAAALESGNNLPPEERCDRALFTVACKAALKAGIPNDAEHNKWILDKLFDDGKIKYCPHGRPVAKVFTRREADKWFDR